MACEDPDAPLFFACHLEGEGTVSEDRKQRPAKTILIPKTPKIKNPQQAAGIINASANGLDSITGFIGSFMGNSNTPQHHLRPYTCS